MTYTPEEMYQYCEDNDLLFDLWMATFNNKKGFDSLLIDGQILKVGDKHIFRTCMLKEGVNTDIEISEEWCTTNRLDEQKPDMYYMLRENGELSLLAIFGGADDERDIDDYALEQLLLEFIRFAGINTKGRLTAVLKTAKEMHEEFTRQERLRELVFGEG